MRRGTFKLSDPHLRDTKIKENKTRVTSQTDGWTDGRRPLEERARRREEKLIPTCYRACQKGGTAGRKKKGKSILSFAAPD